MSQLNAYRSQIYNFLKTTTIKFDELGKLINNNLQYTYSDIILDDRTTWPYYINMTGEYHASNEMMTTVSLDTGEEIDFTKENLRYHPLTRRAYRVHTSEYKVLCKRYPDQIDLIKSIVYPVKNMESCIDSDDFTLLNYDESYLDRNERYSLIEHTRNFLSIYSNRWYVDSFNYEELYPVAFWSILLLNLPLTLFSKRYENIKTPNVHTFHVWEYLTSKGLSDYREILTDDQALFLYRNIDYLYKNKGKDSTLKILAENILKKLKVSLIGKDIYHEIGNIKDTCLWEPEIISTRVKDNRSDFSKYTSIREINTRLYTSGLSDDNSVEFAKETEKKLARTKNNILTTKLLELKKYIIDNKYENILVTFLIDNLMNMLSKDLISDKISIYNETSNINIDDITLHDSFILLYYCAHRSRGRTPTNIPDKYTCTKIYKNESEIEIPEYFYYKNNKFRLKEFIDVDGILDEINFDSSIYTNLYEAIDMLADQFLSLIKHVRFIRSSSNKMVHLAMKTLYDAITFKGDLSLDLSIDTEYQDWRHSVENLDTVFNILDSENDPETAYDKLYIEILNALLPKDNEIFDKFISIDDKDTNILYTKLKNLFVQLCSYNIVFLDTQREESLYFFLSNLPVDIQGEAYESSSIEMNPTVPDHNIDILSTDELNVVLSNSYFNMNDQVDSFNIEPGLGIELSLSVEDITPINIINRFVGDEYLQDNTEQVDNINITETLGYSVGFSN